MVHNNMQISSWMYLHVHRGYVIKNTTQYCRVLLQKDSTVMCLNLYSEHISLHQSMSLNPTFFLLLFLVCLKTFLLTNVYTYMYLYRNTQEPWGMASPLPLHKWSTMSALIIGTAFFRSLHFRFTFSVFCDRANNYSSHLHLSISTD